MRLLLTWLMLFVFAGCATDPPGDAQQLEPIDSAHAELINGIRGLQLERKRDELQAASLLPDLRVLRPSVNFQRNDVLEIVGRVENIGGSDAGEFTLRYQVWFFGPNDRQSGELFREETWPGVPNGTRVDADEFLLPEDRMLFNVAGWDPPVAVAILMNADPVSRQSRRGRIDEINDTGNNVQIYSWDPADPTTSSPWIVVHKRE